MKFMSSVEQIYDCLSIWMKFYTKCRTSKLSVNIRIIKQ